MSKMAHVLMHALLRSVSDMNPSETVTQVIRGPDGGRLGALGTIITLNECG